eukprot:scaffold242945_cov19-Tisochrysis_lutea.AAC.2
MEAQPPSLQRRGGACRVCSIYFCVSARICVRVHAITDAFELASWKMAARLRPVRTKHEALRKAMKDEALRGCTFRPRLNSNFINGKPVE